MGSSHAARRVVGISHAVWRMMVTPIWGVTCLPLPICGPPGLLPRTQTLPASMGEHALKRVTARTPGVTVPSQRLANTPQRPLARVLKSLEGTIRTSFATGIAEVWRLASPNEHLADALPQPL